MVKRKRAEPQETDNDEAPSKERVSETRDQQHAELKDDDPSTSKPEVHHFEIPFQDKAITCERRGGRDANPQLIFTHGAGGGLSNPATAEFADGFAEISPIVSFKGSMNLQSRTESFKAVYEHEDAPCALGGRSMGARSAVLTAQNKDSAVKALILVSYPMVGAQRGDSREQILLDLPEGIDVLFISGTKDSMCPVEHLRRVMGQMNAKSWLVEVDGADHGMSLTPKAGVRLMRIKTGFIAAEWLIKRNESKTYCNLKWDGKEGKVVSRGWQESPGEDLKDTGSTAGSQTRRGKKDR